MDKHGLIFSPTPAVLFRSESTMKATVHSTLFPFWNDLRNATPTRLRRDLWAGLTVAIFAIPQAIAYAILAGASPVYGLYSALVMSVVAALWGSSPYVNTGPTNSAALLAAAALLPFSTQPDFLRILFGLTLLVGILRLALGLLRAGRFFQYVPESGLLGFTVGAGILIASGQLHHLLGVAGGKSPWFIARMAEVAANSRQTHLPTLAIGAGCFVALLILDRTRWRSMAPLMVLAAATALTRFAFPVGAGIQLVGDISPVPSGLPTFSMPALEWTLLPSAGAIAVVGLIEASSIGQTLAVRRHQNLDFNQEFIGQGLSQIIGSFFQCIPGSGSFSRSLLIEHSGGVSRFANVFFGLWTALAVITLPPLLESIPVCALGGLLLFIGWKLVDIRRIRRVMVISRADTAVMFVTLFVTVFHRIENGVFVGTTLAALVFLGRAGKVHLHELVPAENGRYRELPYDRATRHDPSALVALSLSGNLFYGVANALRDYFAQVMHQSPTIIILRLRRAHSIDSACWGVISDLAEQLHRLGGKLYIAGAGPEMNGILNRTGLSRWIGPDQIFLRNNTPFSAFEACLRVAQADLPPDKSLSTAWKPHSGEMDGSGV